MTGKAQVSDKKRELIISTAREMGYKPNKFARALVRGEIKMGVVIPAEPHEFLSYLRNGVEHAFSEYADYNVKGVFRFFPDNNATKQTEEALRSAMEEDIDGLVLAPGFGGEAYISAMREVVDNANIPVVLVGQELPGIENVALIQSDADAMGSMASQLLGLCIPRGSDIAVITSSSRYIHHRKIIQGFSQENEQHGWFSIKAVVENFDNPELSFTRTRELIEAYQCLRGIYVTSYNFIPVCECLKQQGRSDIAVIGHDLYPEMEPYLLNGPLVASIYQNPFLHGQTAVQVLYEAVTEEK